MYSAKTREEVKEGVYYLVLMPIVPMIGAGVIYCWLIIWILIKIIRNINNFIDNKIDSLRIIDQDKEKMSDPDWDPLRDIINRSDSEYNQYEL